MLYSSHLQWLSFSLITQPATTTPLYVLMCLDCAGQRLNASVWFWKLWKVSKTFLPLHSELPSGESCDMCVTEIPHSCVQITYWTHARCLVSSRNCWQTTTKSLPHFLPHQPKLQSFFFLTLVKCRIQMTHRSLLHKLSHRKGKVSVWDFANRSQQHSEVENLNSKKVISEWQYYPLSTASCSAGGGQTEADCSATMPVSVTANEVDYLTGHGDGAQHINTAPTRCLTAVRETRSLCGEGLWVCLYFVTVAWRKNTLLSFCFTLLNLFCKLFLQICKCVKMIWEKLGDSGWRQFEIAFLYVGQNINNAKFLFAGHLLCSFHFTADYRVED